MEYSHEIIVPNDDLPFKMFIFEGSRGGYIRQKHGTDQWKYLQYLMGRWNFI